MGDSQTLIQAGVVSAKASEPSHVRVDVLCHDLISLLDEYKPATILLEWCSGHVGRKRHHGAGAGLSIFGLAVGAIWREVVHWRQKQSYGVDVYLIEENRWTRQVPKETRQLVIAQQFPEYEASQDAGADASDAIGLSYWFLQEQLIHSAQTGA